MACHKCFSQYIDNKKAELLKAFPDYENLTETFFRRITDFVAEDFEGFSENKVYRIFLKTVKDIVNISFEEKASKSYLRSFWKIIDTKDVCNCLTTFMRSKSSSVKCITARMVNFYVYLNTTSSEEYQRREIFDFLDSMI